MILKHDFLKELASINFNILYWYGTEMKKTKWFFKPDFFK